MNSIAKSERIETFIHTYERYIAPFTFVLGFLFDTLTLRRIDFLIDHIVLIGYLLVAGGSIMLLHAYRSGRLKFGFLDHGIQFVPVIMQFAFGGLFSAFVIFYTTSGSVIKSWLFLGTLAILLVGNERFRLQYKRFVFHMSIFFFALFSYLIFALPIFLGRMDRFVFFVAGIASIFGIAVFFLCTAKIAPSISRKSKRALMVSVGGIYIAFNILYFANIIPPVPLSLKESGIYHSVAEQGNAFAVTFEPAPWYALFQETSRTFHWARGEPVYMFSSVFAPTKISLGIAHQWSHYDEKKGEWVEDEIIRFSIIGGRDQGYRGYSFKRAIIPGKWRVAVITEAGHVLGRETFTVVEAANPSVLASKEK